MNSIIRKVINKWKLNACIKSVRSKNKNPRTYKVWEHRGWGDHIEIININKNGTFSIIGHLAEKPHVGDYIIYDTKSGHKGKGIVSHADYPGDPWDMFFATVIPIEYYNKD